MDEIELRLAALELLTIEAVAALDVATVLRISASIEAGLANEPSPEEVTIRRQALQLISDGLARFQTFGAVGTFQVLPRTTP